MAKVKIPTAIALAVLVAAMAFAGWAAWTWYDTKHGQAAADAEYAATRDSVLVDARASIALFNTMDFREVDEGLDRWLAASTGDLHKEVSGSLDETKSRISDAETVTKGTVLDAAVTELDAAGGKATVIATVEMSVTPPGGEDATTKRLRVQAELVRADSGRWKLATMGQVPVGLV